MTSKLVADDGNDHFCAGLPASAAPPASALIATGDDVIVRVAGRQYLLLQEAVMSSSLRWLTSLLLVCASATQVWADAGIPFCPLNMLLRRDRPWNHQQPPVEPEYDLVIVRDANAKEAELRIPRKMMVADASAPAPTRTAMIGLALSLSVVALGMWCVRYRPREIPKKKLVFGAAVVAMLIAAFSMVTNADARMRPALLPLVTIGEFPVTTYVVDQGDQVQLIVPPAIADKIADRGQSTPNRLKLPENPLPKQALAIVLDPNALSARLAVPSDLATVTAVQPIRPGTETLETMKVRISRGDAGSDSQLILPVRSSAEKK
ncbi:MAG TPA: hypothetical protein VFE62_21150 [Gemmataceae bacterium]|nr:hypothetical protein [Gemmataceae bacterium]